MDTITEMRVRFPEHIDPVPPIPLPDVDFSKDYIVIWVPGTSDKNIPYEFSETVKLLFKNKADLVMLDYLATWEFNTSMVHGYDQLKRLLDYVSQNKRPGAKIMIAGLSQGSMVISELMMNPKYYNMVSRISLLGHPGLAKNHGSDMGKAWEFNNRMDPSTLPWRGDKARILHSIDRFFTHKDAIAGMYLLGVGLTNPAYAGALAALGLKHLPLYTPKVGVSDVHNYRGWYDDAANWLFEGR